MKFIREIIIFIALYSFVMVSSFYNKLEIHFINVGQGDSIYIETPSGTDVLIDAGLPDSGDIVVNYLKNQQENLTIDYVISTHPHYDHSGGLSAVFSEFEIKNFYYPHDINYDTSTWNNILRLANAEPHCNIQDTIPSNTFEIDNVKFEFINNYLTYDDTNNDSAVILLSYKKNKFLFTGDIEKEAEKDLLISNKLSSVDVLKVAHHGSKSSSTKEFLNKVKANYAIITLGENDFGHPSNTVTNRLTKLNTKYYRTDIHGNIILKSNGYNYKFKTENKIKPY